jgi:hypothetical protein
VPSTTTFGWSTPADTDLVKDGALAIRTLADSIDSTMGGTSTLGTTGSVSVNFATGGYRTQAALTGNITYTGTGYASGRSVTIRVLNGSTLRTLTFPAAWRFVSAKPANIAASKLGVLTLTCFGSAEADVVAAWAVEA